MLKCFCFQIYSIEKCTEFGGAYGGPITGSGRLCCRPECNPCGGGNTQGYQCTTSQVEDQGTCGTGPAPGRKAPCQFPFPWTQAPSKKFNVYF